MIDFQRIMTHVNDFFVPHDGLRQQAKDLIATYDANGNGTINVTTPREDQHIALPGLFGAGARSFERADEAGNGNGIATLREVRTLLKQYDTGNIVPDTAGDRHLDGIELIRFIQDMSAPRPTQSAKQAADGVRQIST